MRKKTTIRFTESEKDLIKKTAEYLGWNYTEVIRRSLRFGINSLLKFETNKKMDLRMLEALEDPTKQENDITEEDIKIANTKWLKD